MAASSVSDKQAIDEKLKQMLADETERRYMFSEKLQQLVTERNKREMACEEQRTVHELTHRLKMADATITVQLRDLCLSSQEISRRDKGAGAGGNSQEALEERPDSGYSPSPAGSADMGQTKRQAVHLRASTVANLVAKSPPETEPETGFAEPQTGLTEPQTGLTEPQTGLPEMLDQHSLPNPYTGLAGHDAGEPTEHSDVASQDDTS